MLHCLYKLEFSTPVHFGAGDYTHSVESCRMCFAADTFFSALCSIAVKTGEVDKLVRLIRNGSLRFSDSFPYKGSELWLPKPILSPKTEHTGNPSDKKIMKKLAYIPASSYTNYVDSLCGRGSFTPDSALNDFGVFQIATKAAIGSDEATPYSVATFRFHDDCGVWLVIGYEKNEDEKFVEKLVKLLGLGGIGGKVSSGYGSFSLASVITPEYANASEKALFTMLNKNTGRFITLTTAYAEDSALDRILEGAEYKLVRRGGYAFSETCTKILKKQTGYMFASGSAFTSKFEGMMPDVGRNMPHPVLRYGYPIFIGVDY